MKHPDIYITILYKNHSYKLIALKKLKPKDLYSSNIKMILIPSYEDPNAYIPIKPNSIYEFHHADVQILHQTYVYDVEDSVGTHFDIEKFSTTCRNIVEFINAIYNCYKFRGTSMFIDGNTSESFSFMFPQWVVYPRQIKITFYNSLNHVIDEIDSGDMKPLNGEKTRKLDPMNTIPPVYGCEDRMECLNDILYTPNDRRGSKISEPALQTLPLCIHMEDDKSWRKIKKPGLELQSSDYIFYKLDDFCIYYFMEYQLYQDLMQMKSFDILFISSPLHPKYDENLMPSLDENQTPNNTEKLSTLYAYMADNMVSIMNINAEIANVNTCLLTKVFFPVIFHYIHYFASLSYKDEEEGCRILDMAIFHRGLDAIIHVPGRMITFPELSHQKITDAFLDMILTTY